jgi:hypothetical protein
MMSRRTLIILAIVAVLLISGVFAVPSIVTAIKNGAIVGPDHKRNARGAITVDPRDILADVNTALRSAGKSPIDLNQLALARALRSEHGSDSVEVRRWVGWAIRNASGGADRVFSKLTTKTGSEYSGKFADQHTDARFAATGQAAREIEIQLAREILTAPRTADPTGGATNFFSPRAQDRLRAAALAGVAAAQLVKKNAEEKRAEWIGFGWRSLGAPPGTPADLVEFFNNPSVRIG